MFQTTNQVAFQVFPVGHQMAKPPSTQPGLKFWYLEFESTGLFIAMIFPWYS